MSIQGYIAEEYFYNYVIPPLKDKINKQEELINILNKYIDFLDNATKSPIQIAWAHGWEFPKDVYEEGVNFRSQIQVLSEEIKLIK